MPAFKEKLNDKTVTLYEVVLALEDVGVKHAMINGESLDKFWDSELDRVLYSTAKLRQMSNYIKTRRTNLAAFAAKVQAPPPPPPKKQKPLSKSAKLKMEREAAIREMEKRAEERKRQKEAEERENSVYNKEEDMDFMINHLGIDYGVDESFIGRIK